MRCKSQKRNLMFGRVNCHVRALNTVTPRVERAIASLSLCSPHLNRHSALLYLASCHLFCAQTAYEQHKQSASFFTLSSRFLTVTKHPHIAVPTFTAHSSSGKDCLHEYCCRRLLENKETCMDANCQGQLNLHEVARQCAVRKSSPTPEQLKLNGASPRSFNTRSELTYSSFKPGPPMHVTSNFSQQGKPE